MISSSYFVFTLLSSYFLLAHFSSPFLLFLSIFYVSIAFLCDTIVCIWLRCLHMIITRSLVWHHLPKTAGTTTESLFLASGLELLWNDPQTSYLKHLPPKDHPDASRLPLAGQHSLLNFRRLPHWLLSNYHHKQNRMGLQLDKAPMRNGLFWRNRMNQWLPADWWLQRLSVDSSWSFLRVECLKNDFLKCLSKYECISPLAHIRIRLVASRNRNAYDRSLQAWFTNHDLKQAYEANPLWASFEESVYGSLIHFH